MNAPDRYVENDFSLPCLQYGLPASLKYELGRHAKPRSAASQRQRRRDDGGGELREEGAVDVPASPSLSPSVVCCLPPRLPIPTSPSFAAL
ncbi:hypothetical protein N7532_011099 [Penicillium argentinense]|uniref:Uncharacterized protein n=1 Tax=Penicillium argentinense TaxID=1131581 RepID=A0A9W9EHT1_9EURO|nr:uncharacterized protein N7532_011099 [Penicillium argentinense]KAJ5082056.1 hypothetical protein N7532_011099 [Penicillium argentinense]